MATDGHERSAAIQRLFELRAMPTADLDRSDRALRLAATGCLYLVLEELERRAANERDSGASSTPRSLRTDLRLLFGATLRSDERRAASADNAGNVATLDLQHPARALLLALVDDWRAWQTDPLFRDELDELITEPAMRGRGLRAG